ncbi:MAG: hypothetical protein KF781_08150 [Chitinophagaceae bacterium]|nr:hypothetical protein [Chitinophagaceae bacterium]MCW5905729.1 hypothetical protein [Chitinophagaceae bacterium]
MRKLSLEAFTLFTVLIIVSYTIYSCNKSEETLSANLKEYAIIENKFLLDYDTLYIKKVIDSIQHIADESQENKLLAYYLKFIKAFYGDKEMYKIYLSADTLLNFLQTNNLSQKYHTYFTDALFAKGDYFFSILKYEEALRYYYEAKKFSDTYKQDSCSYNKYNAKMRSFYYDKGEYNNAIPFVKLNIEQDEKCASEKSIQLSYDRLQAEKNTLALCYEKLGMLDSAIFYYRKAIQYILSKKNENDIPGKKKQLSLGIIYGNLGGTFLYKKQYDSAKYYLNQSILLNDKPGYDLVDVQTAYLKLANLHLDINQPEQARNILDKTKQYVTTTAYRVSSTTRSKWYLLNANYYTKTNNLEKAIEAYRLYYHIQDSINAITNSIYTFSVNKEVERIKAENKNKEVEKSNEIKTIYIVLFAFTLLLLSIITLLLLKNFKQEKHNANETILHNMQLKDTLQQLENSNKNYARVMKVMAHDLRSPLSGMIGIIDILLNDENITEKEKNEMLELMQTSANNSLTMIGELLQSSTNFEQREIVKQPIDLIVLLKQCTELLKFKALEKQQTIHFHYAISSVQILADNEKLWRLFSNLIVNAIKFSEVKKSIYIYVEKSMDEVIVSIQDEGVGIPDKFKDKVFDLFTEAKRKGTAGEQPFGLGLSISKQIVEAHKGKIWFISNEPHGTTFYVALPIEKNK